MVKIHIVSGFLGAGKTTFIKKFLELFKGDKNVVLENEFGEISIDGDLIKGDGYDVVELPSGCICCSLKTDFREAIENIIEEINPDNIIIEPTGIGLLSEILNILNSEQFKGVCEICDVVTVIDGENYLEQEDAFGDFFNDQIENAGVLFISKTENISTEDVNSILLSLREINKEAYIIYEPLENLTLENLKAVLKGRSLENIFYKHKDKGHKEVEGFTSIGFDSNKIYTKDILEKKLSLLRNSKIGEIYRAKGIVQGKNGTLEFNYVNGTYVVVESDIKASNKICIIGKKLNKNRIKILFTSNEIKLYKIKKDQEI